VLTWHQSHLYADQETLWEDTLAKNPASWLAHISLGTTLLHQGWAGAAISQFQVALQRQPKNAQADYNLGLALAQLGQNDAAIDQFQTALRRQPDNLGAQNNLTKVLARMGQRQKREALPASP